MNSTSRIGIDIGGTKILGCLVDSTGVVTHQKTVRTPLVSSASIEDALVGLTQSLLRMATDIRAVAIAVAGWVDPLRRSVLFAAHLPWNREPLADKLSSRLGMSVVLENDARAATWAEYQFGVGRQFRDFIVVTVGSGIGCGIVADGRLLRGAHGLAGELGHAVVEPDGPPCPCGRRGCVDILASGRALERHFQELRAATLPIHGVLSSAGEDDPMTGEAIAAAAREADPPALQAFTDVGNFLGRGLADLVMCLDPEAVVLAGGVSAAGELLRAPTEASLRRCLVVREHIAQTSVVLGSLGAVAGAVGVAHLAALQTDVSAR